MANLDLLLSYNGTQNNSKKIYGKKTNSDSNSNSNRDVTMSSYRNVLQDSIAEVSRPIRRNNNNLLSDNKQIIRGDANDDGVVNEKDKELFLNRMFDDMLGIRSTVKINMKNVDFSGDGKITIEDYAEFLEAYKDQQNKSKQIIKGDANDDGVVDEKDKELILDRMWDDTLGIKSSVKINMKNVDFSGDGKITPEDYVEFLEIYRGQAK